MTEIKTRNVRITTYSGFSA